MKGTYEYKSYPAEWALPRVGIRALADNFFTSNEVCSKAFGGIPVVESDIAGDMILAFF